VEWLLPFPPNFKPDEIDYCRARNAVTGNALVMVLKRLKQDDARTTHYLSEVSLFALHP
jgi:hypothetical protein